jgi:hypothetical protein
MVGAARQPTARRAWWPWRRRDLRAVPFPDQALHQWQDPEVALALLYRHAEARAIDAVDWYLEDKRGKRAWSRGLRVVAILLVIAGGLQPVLDVAGPGRGEPAWGYVLLALAAAASASTASSACRPVGCAKSPPRRRSAGGWSCSSTTGRSSAPRPPPAPSTASRS